MPAAKHLVFLQAMQCEKHTEKRYLWQLAHLEVMHKDTREGRNLRFTENE